MNSNNKLENLIIKYLSKLISKKEWEELNSWFEKSADSKLFGDYVKINYAIDNIMSEFNTEKKKKLVLKKIKEDKTAVRRLKTLRVFKYAAAVLILIGSVVYYQYGGLLFQEKSIAYPSKDVITLELDNGAMKVVSEGESLDIVNSKGEKIGTQEGNRLVYTSGNKASEELIYNQLTVPYGKKFEIKLSDGTLAYLNAGSSLKYPINFLKNQKREIFLVGEAFLEVAKDSKRPFVVYANDLDVSVLGTKFNVSAYPEDNTTEVVLVEGSVELQAFKQEGIVLEPGFKGSHDRSSNNIIKKPVITDIYTSWMKGGLVFRDTPFENILKKLERHYNVSIDNRDQEFSKVNFSANFGNESIEEVLNYFKKNYQIEYVINDKQIIIN